MTEMKLCKDCKHIDFNHGYLPICRHQKAPIDPVSGKKNTSCLLMRSKDCLIYKCGINGYWFEEALPPPPAFEPTSLSSMACADIPKRPFWRRIFG
jgi:hypothetical protein